MDGSSFCRLSIFHGFKEINMHLDQVLVVVIVRIQRISLSDDLYSVKMIAAVRL